MIYQDIIHMIINYVFNTTTDIINNNYILNKNYLKYNYVFNTMTDIINNNENKYAIVPYIDIMKIIIKYNEYKYENEINSLINKINKLSLNIKVIKNIKKIKFHMLNSKQL